MIARWAAALVGASLISVATGHTTVAECMPYPGRGPVNKNELPKKGKKRNKMGGAECVPLLLALFECQKAHNFAYGKCAAEEKMVLECAENQARVAIKKDTSRYHLLKVLRRIRG